MRRPLIFHLPGDIPAGEVKIHAATDILLNDLGACRCPESAFMRAKISFAIRRRRTDPLQRPESAAMHHAEALVVIGLENQGVDVIAPGRRDLFVAQTTCSTPQEEAP
jgi:hypothetical protein